MKYSDLLKKTGTVKEHIQVFKTIVENNISESQNTPEELLRKADFKIKLITNTSFGKQIDFAKKYEKEDIEKVLPDLNLKFKEKSVFIIE